VALHNNRRKDRLQKLPRLTTGAGFNLPLQRTLVLGPEFEAGSLGLEQSVDDRFIVFELADIMPGVTN